VKFWRGRQDEADRRPRAGAGKTEGDRLALAVREVVRGTDLEGRGDLAGAEAAYRRADALGSGEGASQLGLLLFERGDVEEAEGALRRSDRRGHPMGTFRLGFLLLEKGDAPGAEAAYRRATERGSLLAANNLAYLLDKRGDSESAVPLYEYLARSGDEAQAASARQALVRLGKLPRPRPVPPPGFEPERSVQDSVLWIGGDPADERVRRAREVVFRWQLTDVTAEQASGYATMWRAFQEHGKAQALLRRGAELGGARAAFELAELLAERGDVNLARDYYVQAILQAEPALAAEARSRLHALP
jgi:Flp pilus assembly protein TadD